MKQRDSSSRREIAVSGIRRSKQRSLRAEMAVLGLSDNARSATVDCRLKWWRFNQACKSGSTGQVVDTGAAALAAGAQAAIVLLADGLHGEEIEDLLDHYECQNVIVWPEQMT